MKQSQLFTKTRKEAPGNETAKNAQLLIRAGFIHKEMAGVYTFLPLGLRVLEKINAVIREEMNAIGGQEILMTALQGKETWEKTRWSDEEVDVWFKTKLQNGTELGLGFTHEEPLTLLMKNHIRSFRDLPVYPYQIQTKFRNEVRSKSGIMRGREFFMKDLYSFSRSEGEHEKFYEESKRAYLKIFDRIGLGDKTFITFASGGSFSKFSHEFQTITEAGEDTVYLSREKGLAVNKEVYTDEVLKEIGLKKEELEEVRAAEVGNIFSLGTRFSDAHELHFTDDDGVSKPVIMGSYGIGPNRLMGTIVEVLADQDGLVWPEEVAPFQVHLISLGQEEKAEALYQKLEEKGVEVLYDDRTEAGAGEKFGDADLMGMPYRVIMSGKTASEEKVEVKKRDEEDSALMSEEELLQELGVQ